MADTLDSIRPPNDGRLPCPPPDSSDEEGREPGGVGKAERLPKALAEGTAGSPTPNRDPINATLHRFFACLSSPPPFIPPLSETRPLVTPPNRPSPGDLPDPLCVTGTKNRCAAVVTRIVCLRSNLLCEAMA